MAQPQIFDRSSEADVLATAAREGVLARIAREASPLDWCALAYVVVIAAMAFAMPAGPDRTFCIERIVPSVVFSTTVVALVRSGAWKGAFFAPFAYRFASYGTLLYTYLLFRRLLPLANPRVLDAQLLAFDLRVFGWEPAIAWDRFVTPATTEWFAFFYFGYFFLLASHVLPMLFTARDRHLLAEFTLGFFCVYALSHVLYAVVPGYGPYRHLAGTFANELPATGRWMKTVLDLVGSAGAMKDIFPSLHTGGPTFIAVFAFRHRARPIFRRTWPITAFATANIVVATMFLRWHYLVDVVAGVVIATTMATVVARFGRRDSERREREGLSPVWPLLFPPKA